MYKLYPSKSAIYIYIDIAGGITNICIGKAATCVIYK